MRPFRFNNDLLPGFYLSLKKNVMSIAIKIPQESFQIALIVKRYILEVDSNAEITLYGSRARGDSRTDSDWDFLVLTDREDIEELADQLRKVLLRKVELPFTQVVSLLVRNKNKWSADYQLSGIYDSIKQEGIQL